MEAKTPRRAASSPAGSSPFSLTSSHYALTVLAGDHAGRGAGDGDLERPLLERFAEEGGRNVRGGNRKLLSWVYPLLALPLLALPAVLTLAAFVVVGFHGLAGSSWFVFLFLLLVMAAGVALCYGRLPSIRFFDGRNWCRNFRSWRGNSGRDGQGVRWLIGGEDDDWGRFEGKGVKKYENGDFYEGEFRRGKCHGRGVRRFSQGGRYEGDWVDGLVDGFGVEIFPVGSLYCGHYKEGARSGYGKMSMYTGEWYAGEWLAGRPHGYGVHRSPRGSSYYGEFKNGEKHGFGRSNFWYQFFVFFFFFGVLVLICVFLLQWLMNVIS